MGWDGMGWDWMGWDGMGWDGMGRDGHQKCSLIFFILRYIKHYAHKYLYTEKKIGQMSSKFIFWSS